jgi:hypothetical protein
MTVPPRKTTRGNASASDAAIANLAEQIRLLTVQVAALSADKPPVVPPNDLSGADDLPDDGDDPRRVAHELLGQSHAVFLLALRSDVIPLWCPDELRAAVEQTSAAIVAAAGAAHVAVASGDYDDKLVDTGLGGPASRPKRLGLRLALQRLIGVLDGNATADRLPWLRSASGWAKSALESFPKLIPGAEKVKEALEVVLSGIDTIEAIRGKRERPS